jgi:hypothetical protein
MKFEDITKFGSNENIKANLGQIQAKLIQVGSTISPLDRDDYQSFALNRILINSAIQVEHLSSYLHAPIEFLAWITRNLFECYLLCEFITPDPLKAKEFIMQKAVDELQINEGILTLSDADASNANSKPILDRNNHIRNTLKKHEIKESGHWTVSMLAQQTNNKDEYEAFFKLYSKYVHPSSWIINGNKSEYDTLSYRNIFLLQAQYYASCLIKAAEEYKTSHGMK